MKIGKLGIVTTAGRMVSTIQICPRADRRPSAQCSFFLSFHQNAVHSKYPVTTGFRSKRSGCRACSKSKGPCHQHTGQGMNPLPPSAKPAPWANAYGGHEVCPNWPDKRRWTCWKITIYIYIHTYVNTHGTTMKYSITSCCLFNHHLLLFLMVERCQAQIQCWSSWRGQIGKVSW